MFKHMKKNWKEIKNQIQELQIRQTEIEENILPKAKESQFSFEGNFKDIENNQKILEEMCYLLFAKMKMNQDGSVVIHQYGNN